MQRIDLSVYVAILVQASRLLKLRLFPPSRPLAPLKVTTWEQFWTLSSSDWVQCWAVEPPKPVYNQLYKNSLFYTAGSKGVLGAEM